MHAYCRPHGSKAEQAFGERWIRPLGAEQDPAGNWYLKVGDVPVLWSAHTDTAHTFNGGQQLQLRGSTLTAKHRQPLGADDTAGCYLLCEMARRGVSGHYVWHSGEERGCLGSRAVLEAVPDWLYDITCVIALDRRGTSEVITHQCGRRTASETFAAALANQLNAYGLTYAPSAFGLYTDSEVYAEVVPECSNIAVGYAGEHTAGESLDTAHVLRLLEALCAVDVSQLPITRDPVVYEISREATIGRFWPEREDAIEIGDDLYTYNGARGLWIRASDAVACLECGCCVEDPGADLCFDCQAELAADTEADRVFLSREYGAVTRMLARERIN